MYLLTFQHTKHQSSHKEFFAKIYGCLEQENSGKSTSNSMQEKSSSITSIQINKTNNNINGIIPSIPILNQSSQSSKLNYPPILPSLPYLPPSAPAGSPIWNDDITTSVAAAAAHSAMINRLDFPLPGSLAAFCKYSS